MIDRERIAAALFDLASGAANFAIINRRLRHWADVAPAEQPFLCMSEKGGEASTKALGAPQTWHLHFDLHVYVYSSDPYLAPATILNPILDAVERALAPSPVTGIQNLGLPEMVQHAYIDGKLETDEGVLGDQAVAVIPVLVLAV